MFLVGHVADVRGDARVNLEILGRIGVTVVEVTGEQERDLHSSEISSCDLVVDAIFGTGLKDRLSGVLETLVADINGSGLPVVSVDLPTGLSADTHQLPGEAVDATLTVTLAAPKLPLLMPPAEARAGDVVIADIGIPSSVIESVEGPWCEALTREEMRELIPPREPGSHKGDFGRVQVIAGSVGKAGAAHLVGMGALRSGAGLVTIATPRSSQATVAALAPEYMTEGLDETPAGTIDFSALDRVLEMPGDVIAVGPGLGTGPGPSAFVQGLLDRAAVPLVIDADGLNAFGKEPERLRGRDSIDVIITPHPGEMARLLGVPIEEVQANRIEVARSFATTHHLHVVLKGHRTVVATPEGNVFLNLTGNPGMATGGMGDVLTGMIAAWFAQLLDAEAACKLAVYLHGLAGDLAEADEGQVAMAAGDLVGRLGDAVLEVSARKRVVSED